MIVDLVSIDGLTTYKATSLFQDILLFLVSFREDPVEEETLPVIILTMIFRSTILISVLFITNVSPGQKTDVLLLKSEKYFSEQNIFIPGSASNLIQEVCYDVPRAFDEEYCLILKISILDSLKAGQLKTIDIQSDTSVIKCTFDYKDNWTWMLDKNIVITGHIFLLSWTNYSIEINLDIRVRDKNRNWEYIYKGDRAFEISKKN